jgi:hypothetical protein
MAPNSSIASGGAAEPPGGEGAAARFQTKAEWMRGGPGEQAILAA